MNRKDETSALPTEVRIRIALECSGIIATHQEQDLYEFIIVLNQHYSASC